VNYKINLDFGGGEGGDELEVDEEDLELGHELREGSGGEFLSANRNMDQGPSPRGRGGGRGEGGGGGGVRLVQSLVMVTTMVMMMRRTR
jgi:hypothetical protein